ncbi:cytochrome p450, partial [Rhizoctonia solani]
MSPTALDCLVTCACGLFLVAIYQQRTRTTLLPLPPGPPRWPLVGSILSIPRGVQLPVIFTQWGNKYGDVSYVKLLGQDIILLNSYEAATELLVEKSAIYSSRPPQIMAGELVGLGKATAFLPYGEQIRMTRKLLHEAMSPEVMSDLYPLQEQEMVKFVRVLLKSPNQLKKHIYQMIGSSLLKLIYGYNVKGVDDPLIVLANNAIDIFLATTEPGAWAVDTIPFLRYIPWAPFKSKAKEWRKTVNELADRPMKFVYDRLNMGDGIPCLVASWIEREVKTSIQGKEEIDYESLVKWTGASAILAGMDTTAAALDRFFALMVTHPEVQKRAQDEITRVIGSDRLPTYADRESLPYIEAVYKEILRWNPIVPIGLPHLSTATCDDEFRGMRIPKGSIVFGIAQNMHHDPQTYHDPHIFNPERFMASSGNVERNPEDTIFGFGRRHVPGVYLSAYI